MNDDGNNGSTGGATSSVAVRPEPSSPVDRFSAAALAFPANPKLVSGASSATTCSLASPSRVASSSSPRYTWYPVTPRLSVAAGHFTRRLFLPSVSTVGALPSGQCGASASPPPPHPPPHPSRLRESPTIT